MNAHFSKLLFIAFIGLCNSPLYANELWSGAEQVVSVQVLSQGGFILNLDNKSGDRCSMIDGTRSYLIYPQQNGITINGAKALLSTAMIAFSTGNKLNVMYSEAGGYCWGQQFLLTR